MGRQPTDDDVYDYGLFLLDKLLKESGRSLKDWPAMPLSQRDWDAEIVNPFIAEQLDYNQAEELAERQTAQLNPSGSRPSIKSLTQSITAAVRYTSSMVPVALGRPSSTKPPAIIFEARAMLSSALRHPGSQLS
ncbi:hypothetical protein B0H17DRAFT_959047 [Mycena rosella]|uniref:Uncharacterized protein n=1 Tax=Mycena rosella TaxID=1033263 RepID=A0AAD7CGZ4_MYCRO|nr:hypothetical protein B0H17DRAFT_959047 [Mycena rosella]